MLFRSLLNVLHKINNELKTVKRDISKIKHNDKHDDKNKSIVERIDNIEKSTRSATSLSKNIKDYIDVEIDCKLETVLENINNKFDDVDKKYKRLISQLIYTTTGFNFVRKQINNKIDN